MGGGVTSLAERQRQKSNVFLDEKLQEVEKMAQEADKRIARKQQVAGKHPIYSRANKVADFQEKLFDGGYFGKGVTYNQAVDGVWGKKTQAAYERMLAEQNGDSEEKQQSFSIPKTPVDRLGNHTDECATYTNTIMRNLGIDARGDAYQVGRFYTPVLNGYDGMEVDSGASRNQIMNTHRAAADKVKEFFDESQLEKDHVYPVNMYYGTSPHMKDFYEKAIKEKTDTFGTHTGLLLWDGKKWVVTHNIHGRIYNTPVKQALGGLSNRNKFGVTAIYDAGQIPSTKKENETQRATGFTSELLGLNGRLWPAFR